MKGTPFDQPTLVGSGPRYQEGMRILGGRFVLERQLGRGGMGEVWLARDAELGDYRALKFLPNEVTHDPKALSQLRREAAAGQRLSHPRIVKTHDLHVADGHAAVAMEYVEGKTLNGLLAVAEKGYLEVAEIEGWIRDVCEALDYAHGEAKMVHRDLKPANIIIEQATSRAKVLDFGISRRIAETHTQITGKDSSGTMTYSSPQQMNGGKGMPADDLYALGATIYEVLTGTPPFFRGDLRQQVMEKAPPSMTERRAELVEEGMVLGGGQAIPSNWELVVAACLRKESERRPASGAALLAMLMGGKRAGHRTASKSAVVPSSVAGIWKKPGVLTWSVAACVAVGFVAWGVRAAMRKADARPATAAVVDAAIRQPHLSTLSATEWQPLAVQGNAFAQALMARACHTGVDGAKLDVTQARIWANQSAAQHHPLGLFIAGILSMDDPAIPSGIRQQISEDYAQKAVAAGFLDQAEAGGRQWIDRMARAYFLGKGVPKDVVRGAGWFRKAAELGDMNAMNNLGLCYNDGTGVTKDEKTAVEWFRKAAELNHPIAMKNLGGCYANGTGVTKDPAEAVEWLRKAADLNEPMAMTNLGYCYAEGTGVTKDPAEALKWYRKAAELNDPMAMTNLGYCYRDGIGVTKDPKEAVEWFRKAVELNDPLAMRVLGFC